MGKFRGFPLNRRMKTVFRCISRRNLSPPGYRPLDPDSSSRVKPVSKLINWAQKIGSKAKSMVGCRVHKKMGTDPVVEKARPAEVPKGYMAVYVGQKDGEFQRVLVPVIYFNHPLFGQLLREAEEVFGFDHPGAITIPCRISEFEHVQTRIKEGRVTRKLLSWKKSIKA